MILLYSRAEKKAHVLKLDTFENASKSPKLSTLKVPWRPFLGAVSQGIHNSNNNKPVINYLMRRSSEGRESPREATMRSRCSRLHGVFVRRHVVGSSFAYVRTYGNCVASALEAR